MDGGRVGAVVLHGRTHGPHAARRNGKRRPTARRRGNPQLHTRSSGQPEPGLRPVDHARPLRYGSSSHVQQNGLLSHPQDLDAPMRLAAERKIIVYGWIGTQRRYGGRKCLFSTTRSQPCSSSGQRAGGSHFTKTRTSCDSPYS